MAVVIAIATSFGENNGWKELDDLSISVYASMAHGKIVIRKEVF
jgi:hypothetical protein